MATETQPRPDRHPLPTGIGPKRNAILVVALAQRGIVEQPIGSNRGTTPNGGVDKFLPDWARTTPGPAWCCFCAFWIAKAALGKFPLDRHHGSCTKAWKAAQAAGVFVENDGTRVPYPGDAFLIRKDADEMRHIGIVCRVAADGSAINTAEGNTGQKFKVGTRSLTDGSIAGWIDFVPSEHPDGFERGLVEAPNTGAAATR